MYAKLWLNQIIILEPVLTPDDRFVSEVTLWVRYAETDSMRIVHHSNYLVYFEEARSDYMRQRGENYAHFERDGFNLAVTEVNARYLRPALYGQQITIRCWIADVQSRGMTFRYEVANTETGELHCSGQTKHICVQRDGGVTRLPEQWREWAVNSLKKV